MTSPVDAVERVVREEFPRILATLVRVTGDVGLAEDSVQEAVVRALTTWPRDGVPDEPRAWLTTVARRCAVDRARRESLRDGKEAEAVWLQDSDPEPPPDSVVRDDLLRLVFTCCHPTLSPEAQVALSLRTLCGLTTAEVARALLIPEATAAKRLTRAKQKIAAAHIPYRVPSDHELPDRLAGVLATVYLVFNEGYAPSGGDSAVRQDLVDEAVRLGRLLRELMPDEPGVLGLLALMLLLDCRRAARVDSEGRAVRLADQVRHRWDPAMAREGVELVAEGVRRSPDRADPYVVQAAIAGCHALAPTYAETDWDAVIAWYDVLLGVRDSPSARLGRASAIAERDGAAAGLVEVDAIPGLEHHAWWHGARAELLHRLGRDDEAQHERHEAERCGLNTAALATLDASLATPA
ncbi:MAG: RNA polymerase sigma factor [Candidatus Nanopelagicales bacterium]